MLAESRHRRCKLLRHPANVGLSEVNTGSCHENALKSKRQRTNKPTVATYTWLPVRGTKPHGPCCQINPFFDPDFVFNPMSCQYLGLRFALPRALPREGALSGPPRPLKSFPWQVCLADAMSPLQFRLRGFLPVLWNNSTKKSQKHVNEENRGDYQAFQAR
jgi:hypothetical protein